MARTAAPERTNPFLTRCNLQPSTPLHEVADPAVSKPELAFRIAADDLLGTVAEAIARIEHGAGLTCRCGSSGRLSFSSRPWSRVILGSEWRLTISACR